MSLLIACAGTGAGNILFFSFAHRIGRAVLPHFRRNAMLLGAAFSSLLKEKITKLS